MLTKKHKIRHSSLIKKNSFLILLVVVILIRVILFFSFSPQTTPDTNGYTDLASHILSLDMTGYKGERTPGYPLIIALTNINFTMVIILQMLMGIIISVSLYGIIYLLTKNDILSLASGLSYSLYLPQLIRETYILTETTATFFVILSFLSFLYLIKSTNESRRKEIIYLLLSGVLSSLAALTRPILIIVPLVFGLFLIFYYKVTIRQKLIKTILNIMFFIFPIFFLIGSWALIIYNTTGTFGINTITGFALMTRVDGLVEYFPNECKEISNYNMLKDLYLEKRKIYTDHGEPSAMTIWRVREELVDKMGMSYAKTSKLYGKIAKKTILNAPLKYSKEVVKGWIIFWKPIGLGGNVNPILRVISKYFERIIFLFIELVFLIFPLMYILSPKMRDIFRTMNEIAITFLFSSYIIILLISIGQALVIAPESRFSVPTDPIIIIVSIFLIYEFKHKYVIENN